MIYPSKYNRSLHAHISKGSTSDDRFMPAGYVKAFAEMEGLVLTEKLDGQNDAFTKPALFARSHATASELPWDRPLVNRWKLIKDSLGDLEIFGEAMYGTHSIAYKKLESYFYAFAVREGNTWLSWEDVKIVAEMFEFPVVPEIPIITSLTDYYQDGIDENKQLNEWLKIQLGMYWEDSVNTPGLLGGYDPLTGEDASEGFVLRNKNAFKVGESTLNVAKNEFGDLLKVVRKGHVTTDEHWCKNWTPAELIDYTKYGWHGYEYLSKK